ncbi:putative DUF4433 domain-containing protein [Candidatus Magnetomoraceae bacterium gMMP-15]
MFTGKELNNLNDLLISRGAFLFHSCQLVDFESYMELSGIASHDLLDKKALTYTLFQDDKTDKQDWTYDKVFLTPVDSGIYFSKDTNNIPNPYGPIVLQIEPEALVRATEINLCLRSVAADGFNKETDIITSVKDADRLFKYSAKAPVPERSCIKEKEELEKEFGIDKAALEIYCNFPDKSLPMKYVSIVAVENYNFFRKSLRDWVYEIKRRYGVKPAVQKRYLPSDIGGKVYKAIVDSMIDDLPSLKDLSKSSDPVLNNWAKLMLEKNLENDFKRFSQCMRNGTLLPIKEMKNGSYKFYSKISKKKTKQTEKISIPLKSQELINNLLKEKLPIDAIARVTGISESVLQKYIHVIQ